MLLVAGHEEEMADVLMKIRERKRDAGRKALEQRRVGVLLRFEIVERDAGEIGDDEIARSFLAAP